MLVIMDITLDIKILALSPCQAMEKKTGNCAAQSHVAKSEKRKYNSRNLTHSHYRYISLLSLLYIEFQKVMWL